MSHALVFAATCPQCKRDRPQNGFTVADLLRLLDGGYPIEGYCALCDAFWSISLHERVRLGEVVTATYGCTLPRDENDYLAQPPSD